jgi:hypothetical protein
VEIVKRLIRKVTKWAYQDELDGRLSHIYPRTTNKKGVTASGRETLTLDEVPRYPPFLHGLPAASPELIISTQMDIIERVRNIMGLPRDDFEPYMNMIRRYAAFVHLLPASQDHHHRGAGGLFRHGLEVVVAAMYAAEGMMFAASESPLLRRELIPRWYMATFIACLCHDIGKPVSDIEVRAIENGDLVWNPFNDSLEDWFNANEVERYVIRWHDNRHKRHESMTPLIVERIATRSELAYISAKGPDILEQMMAAITGSKDEHNKIVKLVRIGDEYSTNKDLKEQRALGEIQSNQLGLPLEKMILDGMRAMLRSEEWKVNEEKATVYLIDVANGEMSVAIDNALFIVWPIGGQQTYAHLEKKKMPGVPSDPNSIADVLIERGIAEPRFTSGGHQSRLWKVKVGARTFWALKIKNPILLLDPLPTSMAGHVLSEQEISISEKETHEAKTEQQASSSASEATRRNIDDALASIKPNVSAVAMPNVQQSPTESTAQKHESAVTNPAVIESPKDHNMDDLLDAENKLSEKGAAGLVLTAFAQDVALNTKKWDEDIGYITRPGSSFREMAIKWSSLDGYGVERIALQAELKTNNMVVLPNGQGNLHDVAMSGKSVKAIILVDEFERLVSTIAKEYSLPIDTVEPVSVVTVQVEPDARNLSPHQDDSKEEPILSMFDDDETPATMNGKRQKSLANTNQLVTGKMSKTDVPEMNFEIADSTEKQSVVAEIKTDSHVVESDKSDIPLEASNYLAEYNEIADIKQFIVAMRQKGEDHDLIVWQQDNQSLVQLNNLTAWVKRKTGKSPQNVMRDAVTQGIIKTTPDGKTKFIVIAD